MKKEMKEEMRTFSEVKVWNHSGSTYGRDAGATEAQLETELETARLEEVGPFHFSESFHFIRKERLVAALD